jgi:ATP-dependent RNA helicase RhlE
MLAVRSRVADAPGVRRPAAIDRSTPSRRRGRPSRPGAVRPQRLQTRRPRLRPDARRRTLSFDDLGLSAELLRAVADEGYTQPTPIQHQAIPVIIAGHDVLGTAQTGTGKTAAFVLPILERLKGHANTSFSPARHPVRALILAPTRELAVQVEEMARGYSVHSPLRTAVVYGGVPIEPQAKQLLAGVEILVATPGRLLDHMGSRTVNLGQVEILVLDEADRMLDMGFMPDIRRILDALPSQRQNLLFSATFSDDVRSLSSGILDAPVRISVAPANATADRVRQIVYPVDRDRKEELLAHLIRRYDLRQVLVFTRTKLAAARLASWLDRRGIEATAIHGDRNQSERTKALEMFKAGEVRVLVATDVAARGLDIEELPHVVNFELPFDPQDYIHRIGRTARAGLEGDAISLVCIDETDLLRAVQRLLKRAIPWTVEEGFIPDRNVEPRPVRVPGGRGGGSGSSGPGGSRSGGSRAGGSSSAGARGPRRPRGGRRSEATA